MVILKRMFNFGVNVNAKLRISLISNPVVLTRRQPSIQTIWKTLGKKIHFNLNAVELFIPSWLMSASKSLKFNEQRANIESFALDINSF